MSENVRYLLQLIFSIAIWMVVEIPPKSWHRLVAKYIFVLKKICEHRKNTADAVVVYKT